MGIYNAERSLCCLVIGGRGAALQPERATRLSLFQCPAGGDCDPSRPAPSHAARASVKEDDPGPEKAAPLVSLARDRTAQPISHIHYVVSTQKNPNPLWETLKG